MRASTYLIVQAYRSKYGRTNPETGLRAVESTKIVGSRQSRPAQLVADQIAVKVTVEVPPEAFDPLTPVALVVVPADLVQRHVIEVEAEDANPSEEAS